MFLLCVISPSGTPPLSTSYIAFARTSKGIRPANSVVTRGGTRMQIRGHGDANTITSGSRGMGEASRAVAG